MKAKEVAQEKTRKEMQTKLVEKEKKTLQERGAIIRPASEIEGALVASKEKHELSGIERILEVQQ